MKQLTVISGKGGTGKTSLTAAFASLATNAVFADCDVDASDLPLVLKPVIKKTMGFHGLKLASVDAILCDDCQACYRACNFNAIDEDIHINEDRCEGCGVCAYVCPQKAITLVERESGLAYISETRFGPLCHAVLHTAEEASGKLVTLVRENAIHLAEDKNHDLILIDGPPGIGCPVIAAISGVDAVLIVTEPTLSGIHDLKRVHQVAQHFNIPTAVCINKYTINEENTAAIEQYCKEHELFVDKLPYDPVFTEAMVQEKTVMELEKTSLQQQITHLWSSLLKYFDLTSS